MTKSAISLTEWLDRWANEPYAYLTTIGRRTNQPHRIEIWFAVDNGRLYLMSGGRDTSDWVRNIQANPRVTVELGGERRAGQARIIQAGADEDARARDLLTNKYATAAEPLHDWKRRSLPLAIDFSK